MGRMPLPSSAQKNNPSCLSSGIRRSTPRDADHSADSGPAIYILVRRIWERGENAPVEPQGHKKKTPPGLRKPGRGRLGGSGATGKAP